MTKNQRVRGNRRVYDSTRNLEKWDHNIQRHNIKIVITIHDIWNTQTDAILLVQSLELIMEG